MHLGIVPPHFCSFKLLSWWPFLFFSIFGAKCVTRCSTLWFRFPEVTWASSLFSPLSLSQSVFVVRVHEWEALMFCSCSQAKQHFSERWLDTFLSSCVFKLLDFYGHRDLPCPTFHSTFLRPFGKSQPWVTLPSLASLCVLSPHFTIFDIFLLQTQAVTHSYIIKSNCPKMATL